jgi:hypothetical protein
MCRSSCVCVCVCVCLCGLQRWECHRLCDVDINNIIVDWKDSRENDRALIEVLSLPFSSETEENHQ